MNDSSTIVNRIKKNLRARKTIIKNTSAYRLYDRDIPEYPYIIDIFNDYAVVYEKGKKIDESDAAQIELQKKHQAHLVTAIKENLGLPRANIILKKRKRQKGKEQYETLAKKNKRISVTENDMKFWINLYDYLDPGLFLDHRPLREIIKQQAKQKKLLNLFAYTGSISIAGAVGGATVTTVDMSKTYLTWAVDNFNLNQLNPDKHEFIQADVLQYIHEVDENKFDLIVLDPPSFSNSKRMEDTFDVQRDHSKLIHPLMKALRPGGILYFSNNFRKFKLDSEIFESYNVRDITTYSIPKDFRDNKIHMCFKIMNK